MKIDDIDVLDEKKIVTDDDNVKDDDKGREPNNVLKE